MIGQPQRMGSGSSLPGIRDLLASLSQGGLPPIVSNPQRLADQAREPMLPEGEVTHPALAPVTREAVLRARAQDELINPAAASPAATPPGAAPGGAPANFQRYFDFLNQGVPQVPEPTQEQIAQLVAQRGRPEASLPLALGAMLSRDKGLSRVGTGLYNAVEASRQPFDVGDGMGTIDPRTGQYTADPFRRAQDERERQEKLRTQALGLATADATREATTAHRRATLDATKVNRDLSHEYRTRNRQTNYVDTTTGAMVVSRPDGSLMNPDNGNTVRHQDAVASQEFRKQTEVSRKLQVGLEQARELEAKVAANPQLFSYVNAKLATLPLQTEVKAAQAYLNKRTDGARGLSAEDFALRAEIGKQVAFLIHDLYGSVLTKGEEARAVNFLPQANEPLDVLLPKLQITLRDAERQMQTLPKWAVRLAHSAGAPPSDELPASIQSAPGAAPTGTTLDDYSAEDRAAASAAIEASRPRPQEAP